jgi:predicted transcriptional regulator
MSDGGIEELYFELSHVTRLGLLQRLSTGPDNLTSLAEAEDVSPQEASRHLGRLQDADLVAKRGDGDYHLTNLGASVVDTFDTYHLLTERDDYFRDHDLSFLPVEFRKSVGVLDEAEFVTQNVRVVREVRLLLEDAKELILTLAPTAFDYGYPIVAEKSRSEIPYRTVFERSYAKSDFHRDLVRDHDFDRRYVQTGVVDDLNFWLVLNEARAFVGFFFPEGEEDISHGFLAEGDDAYDWCRHLFEHYWNGADRL